MFRFNEILKKQTFFLNFTKKTFTGKTETGWKFTTPILKMKSVKPIPPPGNEITKMLPNWTPDYFCKQLGGDLYEHSDKFENLEQMFTMKREELKEKGVPIKQRKYLLRHVEMMKRGLLTFEYLARRTQIKPCRKLTKSAKK